MSLAGCGTTQEHGTIRFAPLTFDGPHGIPGASTLSDTVDIESPRLDYLGTVGHSNRTSPSDPSPPSPSDRCPTKCIVGVFTCIVCGSNTERVWKDT